MNKFELSNEVFNMLSDRLIKVIEDAIYKYDMDGVIDPVTESDSVLKLNVKISKQCDMCYVLSKHSIYKQVWLVSPVSGPYRFFVSDGGKWIDDKGTKILELLELELRSFIGGMIAFDDEFLLPY